MEKFTELNSCFKIAVVKIGLIWVKHPKDTYIFVTNKNSLFVQTTKDQTLYKILKTEFDE